MAVHVTAERRDVTSRLYYRRYGGYATWIGFGAVQGRSCALFSYKKNLQNFSRFFVTPNF
jgi:hypothetical protein